MTHYTARLFFCQKALELLWNTPYENAHISYDRHNRDKF